MRSRRLFIALFSVVLALWGTQVGGSSAVGLTPCVTYELGAGSVCAPEPAALESVSPAIADAAASLALAEQQALALLNGAVPAVDNGYATAISGVNEHISAAATSLSNLEAKTARVQSKLTTLASSLQTAAAASGASARRAALADAYEALATVTTAALSLQLRLEKAHMRAAKAEATAESIASVYADWVLQNIDLASATALTTMAQQVAAATATLLPALSTVDSLVADLRSTVAGLRAVISGVPHDAQDVASGQVSAALAAASLAIADAQARAAAAQVQVDATAAGVSYLGTQSLPLAADAPLAAAGNTLATANATATNLTILLITLRNSLDGVASAATATLTRPTATSQRLALADADAALADADVAIANALVTADALEVLVRSTNGSLVELGSLTLGIGAAQVVDAGIAHTDAAEDAVNGIEALETVGATLDGVQNTVESLINDATPDLPVDPGLPEVVIPILPPYFRPGVETATGTVFAAPSSTWLRNHCRARQGTSITNRHVVHAIVPYSGFAGAPQVSGYGPKVRDTMRAIDRALDESHSTFTQHYRFVCYQDGNGSWVNLAATKVLVPKTADTNRNKRIGCGEADAYLRAHNKWGDPKVRRVRFFDTSIDTGGPYDGYCNYGDSDALGVKTPGPTNANNRVFGYSNVDADEWPRGATNRTTAIVMQEIGHSLGLVAPTAPGGTANYHTKDYPDYMNAGYYTPTDGTIRKDCTPVPTTFRDTFVDCGKDTYWDPSLQKDQWLCTRYNIATDSLYFRPLAQRPNACPPA